MPKEIYLQSRFEEHNLQGNARTCLINFFNHDSMPSRQGLTVFSHIDDYGLHQICELNKTILYVDKMPYCSRIQLFVILLSTTRWAFLGNRTADRFFLVFSKKALSYNLQLPGFFYKIPPVVQ